MPLNILTLVAILAAFSPPFLHTPVYAQTQATLAAPTLSLYAIGPTEIDLEWTAVSGAASYELWRAVDGSWNQIGGTLTEPPYADRTVTSRKTYYYRMRAVTAGGVKGAWSNQLRVVPPLPPPTLSLNAVNSTAISLSWSAVDGAARYDLRRWVWVDDNWRNWRSWLGNPLTGTSYTDRAVTIGKRYRYMIRAVTADGDKSSWSSDAVKVTVPPPPTPRPRRVDPPSRPLTPSVTALNHDSIQISWSSVSRATGYDLRWRRDGTSSWTYAYSVSTGHSIPNLQPETRYEAQVRAKNSGGSSTWSASGRATTRMQPPAKPSPPAVTAVDHDSMSVTWDAVARASGYDLRWRTNGTGEWTQIDDASSGRQIDDLQPETRYEAQVRAKNDGGASVWSESDDAETLPPPPITATITTSPQDVAVGSSIDLQATAEDPLNESLKYSWTADPDVGSFDDSETLTPTWTAPSADQPVTLTLTVTGTYNRIKSDTVILTAVTAPGVPTALSVIAIEHDSLQVTWSAPTSGGKPSDYDLQYGVADGVPDNYFGTSTKGSYPLRILNGLRPNTKYKFRVLAKNSAGESEWSTIVTARTLPLPDISVSVTTSPQDVAAGSSIDLQATANDPITETLKYSWTVGPSGGSFANANILTPTWTAPTPSANQPVTLTLTVTGTYNRSAQATVVLTAVPEPGIPDAPTVNAVDHDSLQVEWSAAASGGTPTAFDLQYKVAANANWEPVEKDVTSPYALNGLTPNTRYEVQVRAKNIAGESDWSGSGDAATQQPPPITVTITTPVQDVVAGASIDLAATANDPITETLKYSWTVGPSGGSFANANILTPTWTAPTPSANQPVTLTLTVTGTYGRSAQATVVLTAVPAPEPPAAPTVNPVDHDSLQVEWSAAASGGTPTAFDLQYKVAANANWEEKPVEDVSSPYALNGLMPHLRYEVQVRAKNIAGTSRWSGSGYAETLPPPPITATITTPPQDVVAGASIDLAATANDPLNKALSYSWTVDPSGGSFDNANILTPTWTAPTPSANQPVTLTLTVTGTYNRSAQATVVLTAVPAPEPPAAPTVTTVDHDSLRVEWVAAASGGTPTAFDLQYKVAASTNWEPVEKDVTSPYALNGLMPHLRYEVQVRAKNIAGTSRWSGSGYAETLPPPPITATITTPPQDVVAGASIDLAATANDPLNKALSYSWTVDPSGGSFDNTNILTPTWTAPTPSANQPVTLTLTVTETGTGTYGRTAQATVVLTAVPAPEPPAAPTVNAVDHDSLQVTWVAAASGGTPTAFDLQYRVSGSDSWTTVKDVTSAYVLESLTPNTKYTVQVRAKNIAGESRWSGKGKGKTSPPPPITVSVTTPPQDVVAGSSIDLAATANDPLNKALSYSWTVDPSGGSFANANILTPTWTAPTPSANQPVTLTLTVTGTYGRSAQATVVLTAVPAPEPPAAPTVNAVDHDSLQVTWVAAASGGTPTAFDLQYRVSGSDSWTTVENVTSAYVLESLTPNTKYTVQVRAKNIAGESRWSGKGKGKTQATVSLPSIPAAPTVSAIDHDSLRITWSAPTSGGTASGYDLQYRVSGSDSWTTVENVTSAYVLESLTPNTKYTVQVRAKNIAGMSRWSGKGKGKTN